MANKQLVFENVARDLTGGQFFDLVLIDGGTSYTAYIRSNAQPPGQPANASQITSVGAVPLIAPSGAGDVVGLGTTNTIPLWTDGPNSVIGNSLLSQTGTTLTVAARILATTVGLSGPVFRTTDMLGAGTTAQAFWTILSTGALSNSQALAASVRLTSVPVGFALSAATVIDIFYTGLTNTLGSTIASLNFLRIGQGAVKSNEAITETNGIRIENAFDSFSPGNTFAIKSLSASPSQLNGSLQLATAGNGLLVKEGVNATMGTGVLNGITEVTIATTKVTANSRIFLSIQAPGGTPLGVIYVSSRIAGTSFGVKGAATDTSTFAWWIVEPA